MRSTFEIAALSFAWIAILVLVAICAALVIRVQRLEHQLAPAADRAEPRPAAAAYRDLLGTDVSTFLPADHRSEAVVLVAAPGCGRCTNALAELHALPVPAYVASMSAGFAPDIDALVLDQGHALITALNVGIAPFAVVVSSSGVVTNAGPVTNADGLSPFVSGFSLPTDRPVRSLT